MYDKGIADPVNRQRAAFLPVVPGGGVPFVEIRYCIVWLSELTTGSIHDISVFFFESHQFETRGVWAPWRLGSGLATVLAHLHAMI
jgi:hypothetical protein